MTKAGLAIVATLVAVALLSPWLALHEASASHASFVLAPPMPVRLAAEAGVRGPYVYPLRLVDRLSRTYEPDRERPLPLTSAIAGTVEPWFPLGTDSLGRDLWSRLVRGARLSLALAALSALGALLLGASVGAAAGYAGGAIDAVLMRACEFVMVMPAIYVVLALRASLPLSLPPAMVFAAMAALLAVVGAPQVARGVRAVVASERQRDYVEAARAIGLGPLTVLARHLLPATRPVLWAQALLLLPAFVLAEATLSFIGLGFDPAVPSWGTMLQEAVNVRAIAEYPWVLAPAAALALALLGLNLVADGRDVAPLP